MSFGLREKHLLDFKKFIVNFVTDNFFFSVSLFELIRNVEFFIQPLMDCFREDNHFLWDTD